MYFNVSMYNMRHYIWRQKFNLIYKKIWSKMYKYIVQQIVKQKVHSYVTLLIKLFVFHKLVECLY